MKLFDLILTSIGIWLLADPAHADPISAIVGIFSALSSGASFGVIIGKLLLQVALGFASSLLQKALAKKQKRDPVGVKVEVEMGDDLPVSTCIGKYATAGKRKYAGVYGDIGGTPNAMFVDVIELGNLPVSGLDGLWIEDQKCTILWDEPSAAYGYPIHEYRGTGNGKDYAWIRFYDGTQTQASPYLLSRFGNHETRPWTSNMIGSGCPYAIMTFRFNQDLFSRLPTCVFEMGSPKFYDIRKDSSVGGNGSHRWNDRSTWEPTVNVPVLIYNIIRGIYYGNQWFFGGQNLSPLRLPASNWIAAAQEAGRLIEVTGQPTEPQFRAGYEITGNMEPLDVIDDLRAACAGRLAENGGSFKLQVGAFGAAVFGFTDDDIIITEDQSFEPFPGLDQTINAIKATFPEPSEKWASKDAPTLYNEELEVADGNRTLPADVQFPAVPFKRQVQRLMRTMIKEERRFRTHQFYLPPQAWVLEPNDVVAWTSERNGYVNKKFVVIAIEGEMTMNQLVTIKEIDPSDYDWHPDFELPTSEGWIGRINAPVQIMQGWTAEAAQVTDANGLGRRPAIRVGCAAGLDDVRAVRVKVRVKQTGAVVFESVDNPYDENNQDPKWLLSGGWCLPKTLYQVSGLLVPGTARPTEWSSWIDVLTDDIRFSAEDLHLAEITQQIQNDLIDLKAWIWSDIAVRDLQITFQSLARSLAEQDLANFSDKKEIRRELVSKTNALTASFTEQITVATSATAALASQVNLISAGIDGIGGAGGLTAIVASLNTQGQQIEAQAQQLTSLTAQVGGVSADARLRFETYATGVSGYAKIGLQTKVANGDDYRTGGLFIYTPFDPGTPSRVVVNAGQFAVSAGIDDIGSSLFLVDAGGVYVNDAFVRNLTTDRITFLDGSVQTTAIALGATQSIYDAGSVDAVTMTTVFQNVLSISAPKIATSRIKVTADIRARATALVSGKAVLAVELWENDGTGDVSVKDTTLTFTDTVNAQAPTLYYYRRVGAGTYTYKIVVKKSASGEDFQIGRRTITAEAPKRIDG